RCAEKSMKHDPGKLRPVRPFECRSWWTRRANGGEGPISYPARVPSPTNRRQRQGDSTHLWGGPPPASPSYWTGHAPRVHGSHKASFRDLGTCDLSSANRGRSRKVAPAYYLRGEGTL